MAECARQLQCKRPSRRDSRGFGALRGRLLVPSRPFFQQQLVTHHTHGSARHTEIMKTEALKQALDVYKFDVALGGARRDEEMVVLIGRPELER